MESHWFQVWTSHREQQNFRVRDFLWPFLLHFLLLSRFPCLEPKYIVILLCFWCCVHHTALLSEQRPALCWIGIGPGPGSGVDSFWIQISKASCIPYYRVLRKRPRGPPPFASRARMYLLKSIKISQLGSVICRNRELYERETYKGEICTK